MSGALIFRFQKQCVTSGAISSCDWCKVTQYSIRYNAIHNINVNVSV